MIQYVHAKSMLQTITYNGDMWFGLDYNVNLYRGCSFGCIYCDSRSEHYRIDNFDTITLKKDALQILERELKRKKARGVVGLGAMSDSYNPLEAKLSITRGALSLFAKYGFGVSLETKSELVVRDIDLFKEINKRNNCIVKLTITTADDELGKKIEPRASLSSERFEALQSLSEAGVFTGVLMTPLLPFINDSEEAIKEIVKLTAQHGGHFIYSMFGVTLRDNQRDYFFEQLDKDFVGVKDQYQEMYGHQYMCSIPDYRGKAKVFAKACEQYGLLYKMEDIIAAYKVKKEEVTQLKLF